MTKNPILDELYRVRANIQAAHPDDLQIYLDRELHRLEKQGHPIARIKQKSIRSTLQVKDVGSPLSRGSTPAK